MNEQILAEHYLKTASKNFRELRTVGDKVFLQLDPPEFFHKPNEESNSIAVVIQHMAGNMLSRWTDFLTTDGEKPDRRRDEEFVEHLQTREELMEAWERGWHCLFRAIEGLSGNDLLKTVLIRSKPHSVIEAIQRQILHYAIHVGQIVFIAKMLKGDRWQTLSIPKKK